jgi:superfamily II DNA/RNA helicase
VKYDLRNIKSHKGDYQLKDLENELLGSENPKTIAEIYKKHAIGNTLIFGLSVKHCEEIQKHISKSVIISANTKQRSKIIDKFTKREIKCIINCMIFTEGTDIPLIETIIIARPTKNASLYKQMVGRGLRLAEEKEKLLLIDCVGVSTDLNLCTAPTLVGVDYNDKDIERTEKNEIDCNLFDLPEIIQEKTDTPDNWKINYKEVNIWAKKQGYELHGVNWYKHPDGSFTLSLKNKTLKTSAINELGNLIFVDKEYEAQDFFDRIFTKLNNEYTEDKYIWDLKLMKRWGTSPASYKQLEIIRKCLPYYKCNNLTKLQASQILNRLFNKNKKESIK